MVKHTNYFGKHISETCLLSLKNKDEKEKKGRRDLAVEVKASTAGGQDQGVVTGSHTLMDISTAEESSGNESSQVLRGQPNNNEIHKQAIETNLLYLIMVAVFSQYNLPNVL